MTSDSTTPVRPALGVAVTGVVMAVLSLPLTALFLLRLGSWNSEAAACPECAPELFQQHLTETIVIAVLPLLAVVLGIVALLWHRSAVRSRLSLTIAAAAVLLGLACLAVLVSTGVGPLQRQAADAAKASRGPTAEETSRTPAQLRSEMETLVRGSLESLEPVLGDPPPEELQKSANAITVGECTLSNLAPGRNYAFSLELTTGDQGEEASRMLESTWLEYGYIRSGPSKGGDALLSGDGKLPARYLAVNNDGGSGRLLVSMDSICVKARN